MTDKGLEMVAVADDELRLVRGGRSFWGTVKAVGTWIKNHVTATRSSIGVKGTHDKGGGG
jgi:hypothetical protein